MKKIFSRKDPILHVVAYPFPVWSWQVILTPVEMRQYPCNIWTILAYSFEGAEGGSGGEERGEEGEGVKRGEGVEERGEGRRERG